MKIRRKSGFTLIEMLAVIVIVVLLVVGIGTGINAGVKAYRESVFQSNSATLSDILNTTIGDVLRYAENIEYNSESDFELDNYEFGMKGAKIALADKSGSLISADGSGYVVISDSGGNTTFVINQGAYTKDLLVEDFSIKAYKTAEKGDSKSVGYYFDVSYKIVSEKTGLSNEYSMRVRQSNADIIDLIGSEEAFVNPDAEISDFDGVSYIIVYHANCDDSTGMKTKYNNTLTNGRVLRKLNVLTDVVNYYISPDDDEVRIYGTNDVRCDNYHLLGWSTEANGEVVFAAGKGTATLKEIQNLLSGDNKKLELYAKWGYTITFMANADKPTKGAVDRESYAWDGAVFGEANVLPGNMFTKTGTLISYADSACTKEIGRESKNYEFLGWSTKKVDWEEIPNTSVRISWPNAIQPGEALSDNNVTTLYAAWQKSVPIDYLSESSSAVKQYADGWKLDGWIQDGKQNDIPSSEVKTGSKYVQGETTKVYMGLSRSITFNSTDGKLSDGNTTQQQTIYNYNRKGGKKAFTFPTATKEGWTLDGWYTAKSGGTKVTESNLDTVFSGTSGEITLYAHWKAIKYTVKFDANGGTVSPAQSTKTYGQSLSLPDATSPSYKLTFDENGGSSVSDKTVKWKFLGWSTSKSASSASYTSSLGTDLSKTEGDTVTLYAVWDKSGATVSLPDSSLSKWNFAGWTTTKNSSDTKVGRSYTVSGNVTLYALWSCNVTFDTAGGSTNPNGQTYYKGSGTINMPSKPEKTGHTFAGWGPDKIAAGAAYTPSPTNGSVKYTAHWTINNYTITLKSLDSKTTIKINNKEYKEGNSVTVQYNSSVSVYIQNRRTSWKLSYAIGGEDGTEIKSGVIGKDTSATITFNMPAQNCNLATKQGDGGVDSCVASGTLITMADGSYKRVEDITMNDKVLAFNHETGKVEAANISFIEADGWTDYNVINLNWSNGVSSKIIYEHGFFDLDLMKYVYIHEDDYEQYIGHRFYLGKLVNGEYVSDEVVLESASVSNEYCGCYSFPTEYHLNFFMEDMLSMPGGISGMFNIFDYGADLKYDEEKMAADIEAYGLFDYSNVADYMSYDAFCKYPSKYVNVSIGKGIMSEEDLMYLIERYAVPNDD